MPARSPVEPTEEEKAARSVTHVPFRSWCAACVASKAASAPHRRVEGDEGGPPRIEIDFLFLTAAAVTDHAAASKQRWWSRRCEVLSPW